MVRIVFFLVFWVLSLESICLAMEGGEWNTVCKGRSKIGKKKEITSSDEEDKRITEKRDIGFSVFKRSPGEDWGSISSYRKDFQEYFLRLFEKKIDNKDFQDRNLLCLGILFLDEHNIQLKTIEQSFISGLKNFEGAVSVNNFWKYQGVDPYHNGNEQIASKLGQYGVGYNPGDLKKAGNRNICTEPAAVFYLLENSKKVNDYPKVYIEMITDFYPCGSSNNRCFALLHHAFDGIVKDTFGKGRDFSFNILYSNA